MNMNTGRKMDVFIEDYIIEDERTGLKTFSKWYDFVVWADKNKEDVIKR